MERHQHQPAQAASAIRTSLRDLHELDPEVSRFTDAVAVTLTRVADADQAISDDETRSIEKALREAGPLPEDLAVLVVELARSRREIGGCSQVTETSRHLRLKVTPEQRRHLLEWLLEVATADGSLCPAEQQVIQQIAAELGLDRSEIERRLTGD